MSSNSRTGEPVVCVEQAIPDALSRSLHQATQPLTVLQGTLELALLSASTVQEYKQAVERSLEELQRVTDSFEHLRTLAQEVQQKKSEVAHV
jgi:hypothetical protein